MKLILIGIVLLLCQIPVLMIDDLVHDRETRCISVEREISSKWGGIQMMNGPVLSIPVLRLEQKWKEEPRWVDDTLHILPETLSIEVVMDPEIRYRGIYEAVLYRSKWKIRGSFPARIELPTDCKPKPGAATLTLGISDIQGIVDLVLRWNGEEQAFQSRCSSGVPVQNGILGPVPFVLKQEEPNAPPSEFEIDLSLNGCRELLIASQARKNSIRIASSWNSPSFIGSALPGTRTITEDGFEAEWTIAKQPYNRDVPLTWLDTNHSLRDYASRRRSEDVDSASTLRSTIGVSLHRPISSYRQVARAVDYDVLVFVIILMSFLIAERATRVWMHPLQYFVAGLSLALFYSILLAFTERIGFSWSYLLATVATVLLCVFYSALIFRKRSAAVGLGVIVTLAYALIFVILRLQDYALMAGTAVMFVLLAVLMAFTGKLNQGKDADSDPA